VLFTHIPHFKTLRIIFKELHTDKNPLKDVLLYVGMFISACHRDFILFTPYFNTILQGIREGMD